MMNGFNSVVAMRDVVRIAIWGVATAVMMATCSVGFAEDEAAPAIRDAPSSATPWESDRQPPVNGSGPQAVRSGGLLEHSFNYRQQAQQPRLQEVGPPAGYARSGGWYGYGFPVNSYRWGYFGAERNYPRVIWHTGYYGDCVRTAYRYGY